jgi:hypothetical protein
MHIDDMLTVQKSGPVVLAGQSLGGMTSLEVALQVEVFPLARSCLHCIVFPLVILQHLTYLGCLSIRGRPNHVE